MALVTVARYQAITGDTASASGTVESALAVATDDLGEELRRPLESAVRTERCRIYHETRGLVVYPQATPITSAPSGYTLVGTNALVGATPVSSPAFLSDDPDYASITYTGGWTAATVPRAVERAIAWAAYADLNPTAEAGIPSGVVSASVGDASVTYAGPRVQGERRWPRSVRAYRHRPVRLGAS